MTYTMDIETENGIQQHPFHLGTDKKVAETIVLEKLNSRTCKSIALRKDGKLVKVYNFRNLKPQN